VWLIARFVAALALLHCALGTPPGRMVERWLAQGDARASAWLLGAAGVEVCVEGASIWCREHAITVIGACSVLTSWFFVAAGMLAFPSGWLARASGVVLAFAALSAVNVLRIATVFWVGRFHPDAIVVVHEGLWPSVLNFAALALLALWLGMTARR
jgi:exosortase/archaeosortase family protein